MKYSSSLLVGCLASVVNAGAYCADVVKDSGNYYCPGAVKQIKYAGLDIPGQYRAVSTMTNEGECTYETKEYSGPIAPYDEDLSMHFRGPLKLMNVAVYQPSGSSSSSKRSVAPKTAHSKRHGHQHLHRRFREQQDKQPEEKRADMVTATIDGVVQTWENNYFGGAATTTAAALATPEAASSAVVSDVTTAAQSSTSESPSEGSSAPIAAGDFARSAYYNAADGTADGLVFLANVGEDGVSGTFNGVWGASLAYVDENGEKAAPSPAVLKDMTIPDVKEIAIFSDKKCDSSCGTYRPDSVAYKGFEGATKVFVAQFTMPDSGQTADGTNMPAFWLLNGRIPRTGQYSSCSCWKGDNASPQEGGCGELDAVEVLMAGDRRAKSTFHFMDGTGDSHYFARPEGPAPMTVAVVLDAASSTVSIKQLASGSFDFPTGLTAAQVQDMVDDEQEASLFSLMTFSS
ncbi:TOS1 protein [Xylariaceae sp. FL0804]|nr:TOS1 protein [Xylariaceae sp. FL0804]